MIRFLEVKGVYLDDKKSFAFYDTVNDKLLEFDGGQVFDDIEEFDLYYNEKSGYDYDKIIGLIPKDYFSDEKD